VEIWVNRHPEGRGCLFNFDHFSTHFFFFFLEIHRLRGWGHVSVRVEHQRPPAPCWREDELVGSSPDAALDRSQERHPAIATGLTILDASDTPAGFLYIVLVGTIFRDKPNKLLWSPVRSQQASPETAPFESGFSESLVYVVSIYSRASLRPPSRCWRVTNWSGRPRKTSDGRYRCCFPHNGQVTIIDWNGNSFTPEETGR
jgi:hypothetical protein